MRVVAATGAIGAAANSTQALAQAADNSGTELQEIVLTGTRILRAVDAATASPVTTIDQTQISESGLTTMGDLVSQLPMISGAAVNAALNNGGGFGEANVELRGLDAKRTLVLLNGRRIGVIGNSGAVDINQIPVSIIERVDVLKEGAGAVYGSDAIAGVVNFITRKGVDGLEIGGDVGRTTHADGDHYSLNALWGGSSDKFDFVVGGAFTSQDGISANNRSYSREALYLYSGSSFSGRGVLSAGSSRIPTGRASLPAGHPLRVALGCSNVTRIDGAVGNSQADYRCYSTANDAFNYQPFNLNLTPQERGSIFASTNYKFNDDLEAYTEVLINHTHSGFQIAPLPFDATADDVIISAANQFNPFGIDFGGLETTNPNYRTRFVSLGNRDSASNSDSGLLTVGLKGNLFHSGWQWDANVGYNRLEQKQRVDGYLYLPALQDAVGPSFQDGGGAWHCGTDAAHEIAGCTPMNFFNTQDPVTIAQLGAISTPYHTTSTFVTRSAAFGVTGSLFTLPAGDLQVAAGVEYAKLETDYDADFLIQAEAPLFLKCLIANEACSGNTHGGYDNRDVYLEAFVPILKDVPGAAALNVDIGVRRSDYSLFGSTTKGQVKLEYKPVNDLLIRGTYSQVQRVPTLNDLFAAPLNTSSTFTDPCFGVTAAQVAANPNLGQACQGAALDGSFSFNGTAQITGLITSNVNLKPETGHVITYGFVLQVPFVDNLSVSVDAWDYDIKNLITTLDPNYSIQQCIDTGDASFCGLVTRFAAGTNQGQIKVFVEPTVNLGELKTNGVDFGAKYALGDTAFGKFRFSLDASYLAKYESISLPGSAPQEYAGTYGLQFGNYARLRGTARVNWSLGDFDAMLQARYIASVVVHDPAVVCAPTFCPAFVPNNVDLPVPAVTYLDATVGYTFRKNSKIQFGIQNIADKDPPILYGNNVTNINTDVATYDVLGRRFFLSFNQKF